MQDSKPQIFISYRRCDKPYVDELVEEFLKFECSENVTFWFDGDIMPGDNYSKEISHSLRNCKLFILLVTPRILEENNFVMRYEYPMALKLKKKLIAVETEKTNRSDLIEKFPGLPNPVSLKQIGAIEAEILKILKNRSYKYYALP